MRLAHGIRCLWRSSSCPRRHLAVAAARETPHARRWLPHRSCLYVGSRVAYAAVTPARAAPFAGRLADLGLTKPATSFSMLAALSALIVATWADHVKSVSVLAIAGLSLDAAVQMCLVLSLRSIYMLESAKRSRLNGLFMAWVFGCGAAASARSCVPLRIQGLACVDELLCHSGEYRIRGYVCVMAWAA